MFTVRKGKKYDIEVDDALELIENNRDNSEFIIIDVRTPEEYSIYRIENSFNIDLNSADFINEIGKLERGKTYLVYCHSGRRSSKAIQMMEKLDFKNLNNLSGGISKWNKKGLPLDLD